MLEDRTAAASMTLPHPPEKVWDALTEPEIVKQWMSGTELVGDLVPGGTIFYRGEWNGAAYADRGNILELDSPRLLKLNFYSTFSGLPDEPQYWQPITYALEPEGDGTRLTITHENNPDAETAATLAKNWAASLDQIKKVLASL